MATKKSAKLNGRALAVSIASTAIRVALVLVIIVVIYKLTGKAYEFGYRIFAEEPMTEGSGITVTVSYMEDDSVQELGQKLYDQGLIRDTMLFYFQEMFSNYHGLEQAGVYELNTSMTVEEMLEVISEGMPETVQPLDELYASEDTEESTEDYTEDGELVGASEESSDAAEGEN